MVCSPRALNVIGPPTGFGNVRPSPGTLTNARRPSATTRLRVVSMAMDDLPLAVLAPVDVGDADGDRLDRAAGDGPVEALEAEGVGQVAADADHFDIEAEVAHVG